MSISVRRFWGLAIAGLAVIVLRVCGGGSNDAPSGPTVPAPPVAPTPEPLPTPEPALSASCAALPTVDPFAVDCNKEQATFQAEVDDAIRRLQSEQPQIFGPGRNVLQIGAYYLGLIQILDSQGLNAALEDALKRILENLSREIPRG